MIRERAKKLLAEAGYPDGFQTDYVSFARSDPSWAELVAEYFRQIGIDARIDVKVGAAFGAAIKDRNFGIIGTIMGTRADPMTQVGRFHSTQFVELFQCQGPGAGRRDRRRPSSVQL